MAAIGRHLGLSASRVFTKAHELGFPLRSSRPHATWHADRIATLRAFQRNGLSLAGIGQEPGASKRAVECKIRRLNSLRPRHDPHRQNALPHERPPSRKRAVAFARGDHHAVGWKPTDVPVRSKPKPVAPPAARQKSAIVTVRKPGTRYATVPDMTPEEHKHQMGCHCRAVARAGTPGR
jgi:hypothetical protein